MSRPRPKKRKSKRPRKWLSKKGGASQVLAPQKERRQSVRIAYRMAATKVVVAVDFLLSFPARLDRAVERVDRWLLERKFVFHLMFLLLIGGFALGILILVLAGVIF